MLTILDRYILGEFIRKWITILLLILTIFLLMDMLGELADVLAKRPKMIHVLLYFIYRQPGPLVEMMPLSALLAMMFSVGALAKKKEILAIHACGVSYIRLALPLAAVAVLMSAAVFVSNETFVPDCFWKARYLKVVEIDKRAKSTLSSNRSITTKGRGDRFYNLAAFDSEQSRMESPIITDLGKTATNRQIVLRRIDALWAELPREPEAIRLNNWRFHNVVLREFDQNGRQTKYEEAETKDFQMEPDVDKYLATYKKDKEMSFSELSGYVRVQEDRGINRYTLNLRTMLYAKLAFPYSVFLMGMLAYTFAIRSSIRSMVVEFGLALVCMGLWYVFSGSASRFGRSGMLPPFFAAWYGNLLFTGLLVWRFWQLERVPKS